MSDANHLDNNTKNICVNENAFETFQTVACEEESEFITLSDILAEEVKQPTEMPGEFDDFLYENDSASQEFETHLNDVVKNQIAENDHAVSASNNSNNTAGEPQGSAVAVGTEHTPKRGRRRGKPPKVENSKPNKSTDAGSTSTRRSKRERKPKLIPYTEIPTDYLQEYSADTNQANGNVHQSAAKKRRGRKPKQPSTEIPQPNFKKEMDEDGDDICLSKLKTQMSSSSQENHFESLINKPILSDFDYNIENDITQTNNVVVESVETVYKPLQLQNDVTEEITVSETLDNTVVPKCEDIINSTEQDSQDNNGIPKSEDLLVEDTSKRPVRKKARRNTRYQIESDEDLFANVELSDEDKPKRRKKGTKYYSDDDYIPGGEAKEASSDDKDVYEESDSDFDERIYNFPKQQKRKRTSVHNRTPKKTPQKQPEVTTLPPSDQCDDIEQMLESSVIKSDPTLLKTITEPTSTPNQEFENFIANRIPGSELKIKKVSSLDKSFLEIPSINPKELPKLVETASQTNSAQTATAYVQTSSPYALKMLHNINFSSEQSVKACEFLRNILSTTTELGKLMTEKSDEFMQKKINTTHVKDTTKMDYCVKKAFLLFKLAKDNLTTMEETLEKQYEDFLRTNDLGSAIATDTKIAARPAVKDDSDCEIIDEPLPAKPTNSKTSKTSAAAKTVFLNKELSIKIAKKPTTATQSKNLPNKAGKNINIPGKTAVWLNSAVMVKKVNPTNHFLAQDGRNKKPPDSVYSKIFTIVKEFFYQYFRNKSTEVCAQFTSPQWFNFQPVVVSCNYFVVTALNSQSSSGNIFQPLEPFVREPQQTNGEISSSNSIDEDSNSVAVTNPKSLVSLCVNACNKMFQLRTNGLTLHINGVNTLSNLCLLKIIKKIKESEISNPNANLEDSVENLTLDDEQLSLDESSIDENIEIPALKTLSFKLVSKYFGTPSTVTREDLYDWENFSCGASDQDSCSSFEQKRSLSTLSLPPEIQPFTYNAKSLQSIVYHNLIHVMYGIISPKKKNLSLRESVGGIFEVNTLFRICFQLISTHINPKLQTSELLPFNGLTIDTINTMSDEAFHGLGAHEDDDEYTAGDDFFNTGDYNENEEPQNDQTDENWMTKVQVKELRLGIISGIIGDSNMEEALGSQSTEPFITRIKTEIPDEVPEDPIQLTNLKAEPEDNIEMVNIPEDIVTKAENQDYIENCQNNAVSLTNIDADGFESFISRSKMIHGVSSCLEDSDNIFSQSAYRVRRQHAPDSDTENDYDMSLLVPHDSEVFDMVKTKGNLMHSSNSEDEITKSDKKSDKKKKGKTKKQQEAKQNRLNEVAKKNAAKDKLKQPLEPVNEVAVLTRRMRERIRTEEKKDESDSDSELNLNKSKSNKDNEKSSSKPDQNLSDNEIQCNNVDSTAIIADKGLKTAKKSRKKDVDVEDSFTGFNNDDVTEIEKYKKQLDDVYDKILNDGLEGEPETFEEASNASDRFSPPLMNDEPAEILECEPTMPIFEPKQSRRSKAKAKKAESSATESAVTTGTEDNISLDRVKLTPPKKKKNLPIIEKPFVEKDGWKCYEMDASDSKLNQIPYIGLEKLPEVFVQTYFRYQEINCISQEDQEVDRLANLQSLRRGGKEPKAKGKGKAERSNNLSGTTTANGSPNCSDGENFEELVPSDDDAIRDDDEDLPMLPVKHAENTIAKSSLMDDQESASDGEGGRIMVKKERPDPDDLPLSKRKSTKKVKVVDHPKNLVLTADKMMQKELDMLHAPVNLDDDLKYSPTDSKPKRLSGRSHTKRERRKSRGDDSSSEEEKLWVNTKSKLLKRMEKKVQENTSVDDAKRAKIVSEFIERRTDSSIVRVGKKKRLTRISRKKMLEREKQMRVLSKEFSEGQLVGKGSSVSYSKGRKNIRKVLDKKSLARSTVQANMEEFARKKRLHMKQNRLRELHGYEEDVNVLVINDEVCLEYDFKELQPVVTIHPFFTKVMKVHQYEGVKFMWDACFESLEVIASGHPGSGCILAHCMGLGKTLQVLALLHTVLTHPKVGMQRVLVCCPLSTVLNWVDEIHKWLGPVTNKIKVFELSKLKKTYQRAYQLEDWYTGGGIFIIGYELFRSLSTLDPEYDDIRPTIVQKIRMALLDPGPDIVVCDEGHLLKNDSSVLAIAMSRVKTKRRIVLTGTPMQNNLREYYCMVNFIKPNLLGTYSEYSNRFENPIMNGQHRDSREEDIRLMKARTHILHKVLEGCLQRQEASVLYPYLPTKHEYTVFIKLSDCQTELYKHYLHNYAKNNKNNILKDFHILQKIWSHPHVLHSFLSRVRDDKVNQVKAERIEDDLAREELAASEDVKPVDAETGWWLDYLDNGNLLDELEASTKFQVVFNILKECVALDDKLLIFSTSLYTMDSLEYFLKKINNWSLGQEYYRLDGTVPPEVRHKWCREFNAEQNHKTKLFLISTRAGSLGLNMTAANRVIILDTSWNPAHDIQSIFRIYRFGQKKDCFIYRLVAMGTMEQKIYERSVTKQAVSCRVVDEQQIDRHYNMADLAELYDFSQSGWGISCGVAGAVRDVVLLLAARLPCLYAAHEHDSLLRAARDQDLPEHERAAAWDQFQLEHEHTKVLTGMAIALSVIGPQQQASVPIDFGINIPALTGGVNIKTEPTVQNNLLAPVPTIQHSLLAPAPPAKEKDKGSKVKKVKVAEKPVVTLTSTQSKPDFHETAITIIPPKNMKDPGNVLDKIRELLKNTDFRNANGVIDAAEITKVISTLVSSEQITVAPPQENTISQPIPETPIADEGKKRGRPKKKACEKSKVETKKEPEVSDVNLNLTPDGRYRRRAAVVAEKNLESVAQDNTVVSSDEDYQPYDNDGSQDSDFEVPIKDKPSNAAKQKPQDESILLSDDDEPTVATPTVPTTAIAPSGSTQPIPMHRSLLKNKNFIKIVAHTYLKGNPMLDEDAAMLAAEYSTNKTLKEVEITGKDIDSGPIYDIACQVLGLDILRKLLDKGSNKSATAEKGMKSFNAQPIKQEQNEQSVSTKEKSNEAPKIRIKTENEMRQPTVSVPTAQPTQPSRRKAEIKTRRVFEDDDIGADMDAGYFIPLRSKQAPRGAAQRYKPGPSSAKAAMARTSMPASFQETVRVQSGPTQPHAVVDSNSSVVPVGLFQRSENLGLGMPVVDEECILPDDDDVRISVDPPRPPAQAELTPIKPPIILNSLLSQPTEISSMSLRKRHAIELGATENPDPTLSDNTKTLKPNSLPTISNTIKQKKSNGIPKTALQAPSTSTSSATISLDSDDEVTPEPAAPIIAQQSIPVQIPGTNSNKCIVIPASAFQDILKRVAAHQATPTAQPTPSVSNSNIAQLPSKPQIKTGEKLLIPIGRGPILNMGAAKSTPGKTPKAQTATISKPKPAAKLKTLPKPVEAIKRYPDIAISSSSESERSRSPSPSDPMSVLRNVVHIQAEPTPAPPPPKLNSRPNTAAQPKPSPAAPTKPSPAVPPKPSPAVPSHSKNTRSQPNKGTPSKLTQPLTQKTTLPQLRFSDSLQIKTIPHDSRVPAQPSRTSQQPSKTTAPPSKTTAPPSKTTAQPSKTTAQPSKTTAQALKTTQQPKSAKNKKDESNYRLLGSFDLTDLPEISVSKTPTSTERSGLVAQLAKTRNKAQQGPAKPTTITGKSRDIILMPGNKSGVKAQAKDASILEREKKYNAMKRKPGPAPSAVSEPKKKKPTRLEEFSLDDLEDIIELE